MNRLLTTSLLTLLLLVGGAQVARAENFDAFGNSYATPEEASAADVANNASSEAANVAAGYNADGSLTPAQRAKVDQAGSQPAQNDTSPESGFGIVMVWIVSLFAWLAGVAMVALNYATYYTVVDMGSYVKGLSAVGVTWTILRDIGNIMLIFGFLAVGITTIIGVEWYGGGKKMLPMMLVAAVFLNFSLFISEAVIDTGNLFATQFYSQINGGSLPDRNTLLNQGISSTVMNRLGLQTIYGDAQNPTKAAGVFKGSNSALIGFMSIILFIVLAFVLFTLAFVLIARFVVLIFLIILAPIGFAGLAVPMLKKRADQWWDKLFEQTVTAPILFLLLYIALRVITEMSNFGSSPADWTTYAGNVSPSAILGLGSAILTFLVTMGLLLLVVIQAKNLSAAGAAGATKLAGKLSFGAVGWAGRSTIGWGSQRFAQGLRNTKLARVPVVGRAVTGLFDKGATASFDVRGTGLLGKLPGGGINAGEAQKGGFKKWEEDKIKGRETYGKSLGQSTGRFLGYQYGEDEVQRQKDAESEKAKAEKKMKETGEENKREMQELEERQGGERRGLANKQSGEVETLTKDQKEALRTYDTETEETTKTLEAQGKKEMQGLAGKHKEELDQYDEEVETARRNLVRLEDQQSKGGTVSDEEMSAARQSVKDRLTMRDLKGADQNAKREELAKTHQETVEREKKAALIKRNLKVDEQKEDQRKLEETHTRERGDLKDKHDKEESSLKKVHAETAERQRVEAKDLQDIAEEARIAPQAGYVKGLRLGINPDNKDLFSKTINFINPKRNEVASKNILKWARKSEDEREKDIFKDLLKKNRELLEKDTSKKGEGKEEKKPEKKPEEKP